MRKTPVTIVDDFFDYPDTIRKWALSDELEYEVADDGSWPGVRCDLTYTEFGRKFATQVSDILYDFGFGEYALDYRLSFQRVKKNNYSPGSPMHHGWIHTDPTVYTGILYLNKNFPPKSGTTIFDPIPGKDVNDQSLKYEYYKGNEINEDEYIKQIKENNSSFVSTVRVANKYNRLLLFEGHNYHGVESFYHDSDEDRLTMAFFVFDIKTTAKSPLERMKERH